MRIKSFLLFIVCVITTSLLLVLLGPQRSESLQTIVTQTHQQIKNFQENLRDATEKNLSVDPKLLNLLGFSDPHPVNYSGTWLGNVSQPSVVTYVLQNQMPQAVGLARSVNVRWPNQSLLIYDLGLSADELTVLSLYCNSTRCTIVPFSLDLFPSHAAEEKLHAFRPLVLQDALNKCRSIIFLENHRRINCSHNQLEWLENRTSTSGVLGWSTKHAVSQLTHPKMFEYFHKDATEFLFLPMIAADPLVLINSLQLQRDVMLPWVQCALTQDCIHPIGAQSGGCRFDKKPQYRYSGCHAYDTSALNIVLGLRDKLDETRYSLNVELKMFPIETYSKAAQNLNELIKNNTEMAEKPEGPITDNNNLH